MICYLIDGFSLAKGIIEKNTSLKIDRHQHVNQVTYVLSGKIILKMKSEKDFEPYDVQLKAHHAGISIVGEFFKLVNTYNEDCSVLYIVSPECLYEMQGDKVV